MPLVVKEMLDCFDTTLGMLPEDMPVHESWSRAGQADSEEKVLATAKWAQDIPFNNVCPPGGYPTGCVATAMAIV